MGVHLNHFFVAASYLKKSCGPLVAIYRLRGSNYAAFLNYAACKLGSAKFKGLNGGI
jgi:hypothetical protein